MAWFMIRIEGEGMTLVIPQESRVLWGLLSINRRVGVKGFYATRYVQADDATAAIEIAQSSIMHELGKVAAHDRAALEGLVFKVDDVAAVEAKDVDSNAKGFTFFDE